VYFKRHSLCEAALLAKELLHTCVTTSYSSKEEEITLAESFTQFFIKTLSAIADEVARKLANIVSPVYIYIKPSKYLSDFAQVTSDEIFKLLKVMPLKTSPIDFILTFILKSCCKLFSPILGKAPSGTV